MQRETPSRFQTWRQYAGGLAQRDFCVSMGYVTRVSSMVVESTGPRVFLGEMCRISSRKHPTKCLGEVVGLRERKVLLMPFGDTRGIEMGSEVTGTGTSVTIGVGAGLLGRVIDSFGQPLDARPLESISDSVAIRGVPRNPLSRRKIDTMLETGLRAVDAFLPIGKGQRIGIFAGSGVGKSTLLGMIARDSRCQINVIALIGERGREVGDFLTDTLGADGLARSVVVVATSDQPALVRELAAHTATAIAEYFCGQGKDVLLIMDSVTRFAMAHREIGLSVGEPATARGYTPSAFAAMPRLLERAGSFEGGGSITGVYTVLVEGDDLHEPVSDHMRAILDGHIVLSRELANQAHFPAIDVLRSISRVAPDLWSADERTCVRETLRLLSVRERYRDMIEIGAYHAGANAEVDKAVARYPALEKFLMQEPDERSSRAEAFASLHRVMGPT